MAICDIESVSSNEAKLADEIERVLGQCVAFIDHSRRQCGGGKDQSEPVTLES